MEVVGALASFIAIGQAIQTLPKIVHSLKSISARKQEWMLLLNELESLRATHAKLEEIISINLNYGSTSQPTLASNISAHDESQLERCKSELESLVSDLHRPWENCVSKGNVSSEPRVKRRSWVWNRAKAEQLQKRAEAIRSKLQLVMQGIALTRPGQHPNIVINLQVQNVSYILSAPPGGTQLQAESPIQPAMSQPVNPNHESSASDRQPQTSLLLSDTANPLRQNDFQPSGDFESKIFEDKTEYILTGEFESIQFERYLPGQCSTKCSCQCHRTKTIESRAWFKSLFGSLFVHCNTIPAFGPKTCDERKCNRSKSSINLNYRFPLWLCRYNVSLKASLDAVTGYGAYIHFSVPRYIRTNDMVWYQLTLYQKRTFVSTILL
ncbi:hypothetical protein QBC38DRAFT_6163 [Podospora fimiseda]|uniref:Fungal N-terminal domain-containing protein n=1 Tax=Podospora fimiseda TaxID=252190 RepID=A0AAN7BZM7_9PEZI|nr:hypothetical protein QBC38DRAFT_6163 [Podospora fimiseda]